MYLWINRKNQLGKHFFLTVTLLFCCLFAQAQEEDAVPTAAKDKLQPLPVSIFTDTVQASASVRHLHVSWMDTCFRLQRSFVVREEVINFNEKDNAKYTLFRDSAWFNGGFILSGSNCHSFGLAQSLQHAGIDAQLLFNRNTQVLPDALEVLLATTYKKMYTLDPGSARDLRRDIAVGSLLVFRYGYGGAMHTVFRGKEGFYSKNGGHMPHIYKELKSIKKKYFDVATIEVYALELEKVQAFLAGK